MESISEVQRERNRADHRIILDWTSESERSECILQECLDSDSHGDSVHENAQTIRGFYTAFGERDYGGMAACYHPAVQFSDPVFTDLHGDEARAMWHMLCDQGTDLKVEFSDVSADSDRGTALWEARYTFGPSGRMVHNVIGASFVFAGGKIIQHTDTFDLWRWMRMALGVTGTMIGWAPSAKRQVRETGRRGLDRFIDEHPEYSTQDQ